MNALAEILNFENKNMGWAAALNKKDLTINFSSDD